MTTKMQLGIASLALAALATTTAARADGGLPTYRSERVNFTCGATTKVEYPHAPVPGVAPAGWSTAEPKSVNEGGGCGTADAFVDSRVDPPVRRGPAWEGTFAGNLRSFVVEAHVATAPGYDTRRNLSTNVRARLSIDGKPVRFGSLGEVGATGVPTTASATGVSSSLRLGFNLEALRLTDAAADGMPAPGDGTATRRIRVEVWSTDGLDVITTWLWGAKEVRAGIDFNPEALPHFGTLRASA